jgi:hypothetical protein
MFLARFISRILLVVFVNIDGWVWSFDAPLSQCDAYNFRRPHIILEARPWLP